jgi:hypothetical protein
MADNDLLTLLTISAWQRAAYLLAKVKAAKQQTGDQNVRT